MREKFPFKVQQCFLDLLSNMWSGIVMQQNDLTTVAICRSWIFLIAFKRRIIVEWSTPSCNTSSRVDWEELHWAMLAIRSLQRLQSIKAFFFTDIAITAFKSLKIIHKCSNSYNIFTINFTNNSVWISSTFLWK